MCSGGGSSRARRDAERRQKEANKEAERRQRRLDALAAQRSALAASQSQQLQAYKAQSAQLESDNSAKIDELKAQQASEVAGIERAGNAASNSLRILGQEQPMAPSAKQSRKKAKGSGSKSTAASYQRGSASTRGTNLSI